MKDFMGWQPDQPLVLASGSKTRQMMLAALDLPVEIIRPDLDEAAISHQMVKAGRSISGIAEALALQKALAISKIATDRYVLAADQTLECQGRLFMNAPTSSNSPAERIAFGLPLPSSGMAKSSGQA